MMDERTVIHMTGGIPIRTGKAAWGLALFLPLLVGVFLTGANVASAEGKGFPVRVLDSLGREVVIPKAPKRIVSTVPSNTEILYDLGLKDRVVAVTRHCGLTCDVKDKESIDGWAHADVEKIRSLKPDLVLAFGGLQVPLVDRLDRLGIPVFCFCPRTVVETFHMLKLVGRITGTEKKAEELVQQAAQRLEFVKQRLRGTSQEERVRCLRLISAGEVIVAGRYSFQHDIMVQAGGDDIMAGFLQYYAKADFQGIRSMAPQVIVLNGDDESQVKADFMNMEGWKDLPAAREGRLIVLPCSLICHANFNVVNAVEILARGFHPALFR